MQAYLEGNSKPKFQAISKFIQIPPIIASLTGTLLILYAISPLGIGVAEDTVSYLAAAKSFAEQGKILTLGGFPSSRWGPLYPIQLAILEKLPFAITDSMAAYNILLFILTIFTTWKLISMSIERTFFRYAALTFITLSYAIVQIYCSMETEPLFLLLINISILLLIKFYGQSKFSTLLLMGLICGIAIMHRYPAVFMLPVIGFFLLWKIKDYKSLIKVLVMLAIATVPITLWIGRNYLQTGTLTGDRDPGGYLFWKNMLVLADTLTSWVLPMKVPIILRMLIIFPLFFILFVFSAPVKKFPNAIHMLMISSYLSVLTASYITDIEEPRDRLVAPILISLSIVLFSGMERISSSIDQGRMTPLIFKALVVLWLLYPTIRIVKNVNQWHSTGVDIYNDPAWKNSATIKWISENDLDSKTFSNDIFAIYYFTGKLSGFVPKTLYVKRFKKFFGNVQEGNYLIWFENKTWYRWHDISYLQKNLELEEEMKFSDGTIYRITKKNINP